MEVFMFFRIVLRGRGYPGGNGRCLVWMNEGDDGRNDEKGKIELFRSLVSHADMYGNALFT
jgi:hypothetical protein